MTSEERILQLTAALADEKESVENMEHMWTVISEAANESNDEVNRLTDLLYVANEKLRIIKSTLDRVFFERI